ncbi:hypothetical protein FD755_013387 [Muntiacus reevesi]|uniref:SANT domain-containing protein n=1 Tax=Muntiacus reevesi TaxID=9886 RepID=A0A5N3XLD2_MUNRE|nr:hypothetical protein FD755_013387 [Muntiacus reevesi]
MAAHVGASRTPQEVMEHYISMYIHGNLRKACIPNAIPNPVTDHTCPSGGPLSPSLITPLASPRHLGGQAAASGLHAAAGRLRDRVQPGPQDAHQRVLTRARDHVPARAPRVAAAQGHRARLQPSACLPGQGQGGEGAGGARKVTEEEEELRPTLRPLYQFMSCKEFHDLLENMHKMLRAKICVLQRYWRNGITKREEPAEYEAARHKRKKEAAAVRAAKRGQEDSWDGEFTALELLSDRETVLSSSLNLSPMRYVIVKTIIIKDHLQKRQGIPSKSHLPSYLDKVLKKRLLNFLTESG